MKNGMPLAPSALCLVGLTPCGGGSGSTAVTLPNNVKELGIAKDARPNKVGLALAALVMQIGGNSRGVSPSIPALFPIIASLKKDTFWLTAQIPLAMVELEQRSEFHEHSEVDEPSEFDEPIQSEVAHSLPLT